jgi:hypothetical protein
VERSRNWARANTDTKQSPAINGVTWTNGDPTFIDGDTNTTVKLSKSFISIQQGVTSAKFYITPQGVGIIMGHIRSRESYSAENHSYANSDPNGADKAGNYPSGPPPGMMSSLAPFVQAAVTAIDHAKHTPDGAKWDDQYFRDILKPYGTLPASNPR